MRRITALFVALSIVGLFSACLTGDDADPTSPTTAPSASLGPASTIAPSPGFTLPPSSLSQVIGDPFSEDGIDPCSLVSADEVAEILGRKDLTIWRTIRSNGSRLCEYYTDVDPLASVTVRMESGASHASLQDEISLYQLTPGSEDIQPSDLGDEGYIIQGDSLYVLKGTSLFVIFAIVDDKNGLQAAEAFAAMALHRLPDVAPVDSPPPHS
jgi:hypothetical protein